MSPIGYFRLQLHFRGLRGDIQPWDQEEDASSRFNQKFPVTSYGSDLRWVDQMVPRNTHQKPDWEDVRR